MHHRWGNVHMAQVAADHTYCLLPFIPLVQPSYIPNLKQETKLSRRCQVGRASPSNTIYKDSIAAHTFRLV